MDLDDIDLAGLRRRRGAKWSDVPADVLAAWVADMDFPVARPITEALERLVAASDLGYPVDPHRGELPRIFAARMQSRFGWAVDPARVEVLTDVVQGLQLAMLLLSQPGDAAITPLPIYPPFLEAVRSLPRAPVWMRYAATAGGYRIDFDELRAAITARTRLLLLCNPHNPTGRVLDRGELEQLAAIAIEHDLVAVSDEIHADLVYPERPHLPLASLGPEIAARTITLTSATKAFNIAGLRCAVAAFGSDDLQKRFRSFHHHARGGLSAPGLRATEAAWTLGGEWLAAVVAYLQQNRDTVAAHVQARWPGVRHFAPEATYLAWLDFRALDLEPTPQRFFLNHARVAVSDGATFGAGGEGFIRLNFATSRAILGEILDRMDAALARAGRI